MQDRSRRRADLSGLSLILVETGNPGAATRDRALKMGITLSHTAEVVLKEGGCPPPAKAAVDVCDEAIQLQATASLLLTDATMCRTIL